MAVSRPVTATPGCAADNGGLRLTQGFCARVVADSLGAVRHFVVTPEGVIFAAVQPARDGQGGGLLRLDDVDGDGRYETRRQLWPRGGNGIALRGADLFFAPPDAVLRFRLGPDRADVVGAPDTIVRELPVGGHSSKTVVVGTDGALYVNIGSRTNSCQERERQERSPGHDPCDELATRAGIWRFDPERLDQRPEDGVRHATGLRNTVALTLNPATGTLIGVVHGRDLLGGNWGFSPEANAELPAEELVAIAAGDDFGWPYCYFDPEQRRKVLAPEYGGDGREIGRCAQKRDPLVAFPAHWAPNGIAFYTGTQFPARYRGGAFIAFHGSWNRAPLPQAGFNIVFQPFRGDVPAGEWEVFAEGFQSVEARPTAVTVGPDGALFVSADRGERIWRIDYAGGS
ncbi:MAG TPA: PQQ-dependent sugar dehydrogenase [Longimicrobiales bacterium]|nr:PQQ-dependent sugar dehydrogenase [Longimicrobiales bacterium]